MEVRQLPLPELPRDVRSWVALWASIGGAIAFTIGAAGFVLIFWKGDWSEGTEAARLDLLGKMAMLTLAGALVVLVSLGFAINRRSIKIGKDGLEASGGDE